MEIAGTLFGILAILVAYASYRRGYARGSAEMYQYLKERNENLDTGLDDSELERELR